MPSPVALRRLAERLLVVGTALTIYWQPLTRQFPLKASDIVFALALCAWGWSLLREGRARMLEAATPRLVLPLVVLLGSLLMATLVGYARYDLTMSRVGIILLARLVVCIALCLAAYDLARADITLGKRVSFAFLSPVALFPALLVPALSASMWESAGRFQGFTVNPNTADLAFCVALAVAYTLAIHEWRARRPLRASAFAVVTAGMLTLIVWTQSRAYLLGALASVLFGTILASPHLRLPRARTAAIATLAFLGIVAAAAFLTPRSFMNSYLRKLSLETAEPMSQSARAAPASSNWAFADGRLSFDQHGTVDNLGRMRGGVAGKILRNPHVQAALLYLQLLPTNPLGLGVNYEEKFFIYFSWSGTKHHGTNSILDIPVYGGIGGVLSIGYIGVLVAKNARARLTTAPDDALPYTTGAVAAFAGLWAAAVLLGSPLFDYQLWIVTAIALMEDRHD